MHEIEIDYSGRATTNAEHAYLLSRMAPTAYRIAQDVLVAAEKVIQKKGLFTTEGSRLANLAKALGRVHSALQQDQYSDVLADLTGGSERARMFAFFNRFARAYPNWQAEYDLLNQIIPRIFTEPAAPPTRQSPQQTPVRSVEPPSIDQPHMSARDTGTKVIILCPKCQSRMRIPTGIRISVTCKSCGNIFIQEVRQPG